MNKSFNLYLWCVLFVFIPLSSVAAPLEADGWDSFANILKIGTTNKDGTIDTVLLNKIVNAMSPTAYMDEFARQEVNALKPKLFAELNRQISTAEMPSKKVKITWNTVSENWVNYDFNSKRVTFSQNTGPSVVPWMIGDTDTRQPPDSPLGRFKKSIDDSIGYTKLLGGRTDWRIGFDAVIYPKDGSNYSVKIEDIQKAKEVTTLLKNWKKGKLIIIDTEIIDMQFGERWGYPRIIGLTKPTHVKILDENNGLLYETDDVINVR